MKITVTQFKSEAPSEGTLKEGQDYTEYQDGLFREVVDIAGTNVTVTGNVINGVPRIGTMGVP